MKLSSCLLLRPHAVMQRFGLVLEQRPRNLCRPLAAGKDFATGQVEGRVLRMIAGDAAQAVLAEAIDDTADAGPVDRARAHRTGLGGGIERGLRQHLAAERAAGLRRGEALGMRGAVVMRHVAILGLDQPFPFGIDDDAAEGWVAGGERAGGAQKKRGEKVLVALGPAAHRSPLVNAPPY